MVVFRKVGFSVERLSFLVSFEGTWTNSLGSLSLALLRDKERDFDLLTDLGLEVLLSRVLNERIGRLFLN